MQIRSAALFACLGLAACGGGGGGGGTGTVAAAPAPVPAPAPPPPPPTNTSLTNLQYSQTFPSTGSSLSTTISSTGAVGPTTLSTAALDPVSISYDAGNRNYTISGHGRTSTFAPSDQSKATTDLTTYVKKTSTTEEDFILSNPGAGNLTVALTYTGYGAWQRLTTPAPVSSAIDFFVFGVPTAASDLPRTGTATYQSVIDGFWTTSSDLRGLGGKGTLSANFAAGSTQVTLDLFGVSALTGSRFDLGSFSGAGSINSANASFTGNLAPSTASGYSGAYAGRFFGPGAAEAGAAFNLANGTGGAVVGVIVGRK